jgi:hypothetical protein
MVLNRRDEGGKMVSKYGISFRGRTLARAYVSLHPADSSRLVASVWPIEYSGDWRANTSEMYFCELSSDVFPKDKPEIEMVNQLLAGAAIEPWKCFVAKLE